MGSARFFRFLGKLGSYPIGTELADDHPSKIEVRNGRSTIEMRLAGLVAPYGLPCYVEDRRWATQPVYAIVAKGKAATYVFEGPPNLDNATICQALGDMATSHIVCQLGQLDTRYLTNTVGNLQVVVARHELHRSWRALSLLNHEFVNHVGNQIRDMNEMLARLVTDDEQLGETYVDGASGTAYYESHILIDATEASARQVQEGLYALISLIVDNDHNGIPNDMSRHFLVLRKTESGWVAVRKPTQGNTPATAPNTVPTVVALRPAEEVGAWKPGIFEVLIETSYA